MYNIFKRFNSIDKNYINTDNHIHTNWTDGKQTMSQVAREAKRLGLHQIAITDHVRKGSSYFNAYCKEIIKTSREFKLDIVTGFEAKINNFNGDIDVSCDIVNKSKIKIGSVHRYPVGRKLYQACEFNKKISQEIELELSIAAIKKRDINVLGHPGGMCISAFKEFPLAYYEEIIRECKNNDVAFEINGYYHSNFIIKFKPLLKKYNVFVSLGSDSHNIKEFDKSFKLLKRIIVDE